MAARIRAMVDDPALLFVYGTLRPTLARGEPARLVAGLPHRGTATVKGLLYDLGMYPAMVPGTGIVRGDLLEIGSIEQLAAFDAYEECGGLKPLYVRERLPAVQPDGGEVMAWVYLYARPLRGARLIPGGDYAADRQARGQPAD